MSAPVTSFVYGGATVTMEINPLHPRAWEESQEFPSGYDSAGTAYAENPGAPTFRTETLVFPAISWTNLQSVLNFIESVVGGSLHVFTWNDRNGASWSARYKQAVYQQVSRKYYQLRLTLEVQQ